MKVLRPHHWSPRERLFTENNNINVLGLNCWLLFQGCGEHRWWELSKCQSWDLTNGVYVKAFHFHPLTQHEKSLMTRSTDLLMAWKFHGDQLNIFAAKFWAMLAIGRFLCFPTCRKGGFFSVYEDMNNRTLQEWAPLPSKEQGRAQVLYGHGRQALKWTDTLSSPGKRVRSSRQCELSDDREGLLSVQNICRSPGT